MAVSVLDVEFLNRFIANQIVEFQSTLNRILQDSPDGLPISKIAEETVTTFDSPRPLNVGLMAKELGQGADLNSDVAKAAAEIQRLLEDQQVLFSDIKEAMEELVAKMRASQDVNLETIPLDDFMDVFEDVDSDLSNPSDSEGDEEA